ncbi:trypsin-like cysteine/serine peptidase domain-containing protein [Mycena latifolia]|nr:trypsin-like cysteine/serine peptidase domain-containing protein [Mycena latifolia]
MSARAAAWTVEVPSTHPKPESETITDVNHSEEYVLGMDFRSQVELADFQDGGKYRCDGKDWWMMGTGWLVGPDLVVTAGHVVYDKARGCGAATQIKCYIGYNGAGSVPEPAISAVQPRYGSKVVTTESWIKDNEARPHDVAFIQVHKAFVGNLKVFKFTDTVSPATMRLGVVGYPGDKTFNGEKDGELGAQMYGLFEKTTFDLDAHPRHMLSYKISIFGGQSGAPILSQTKDGLIAIGTHCYGADYSEPTNTGNPIGGQWGNDYDSFISLFGQHESTFSAKFNDITYVTPGKPAPPVPGPQPPFPSPDVEERNNNLVSGSRGGTFARAASPNNDLVFFASRAGLHPAGALPLPQATEPLNPDQPPIMESPPPEFDP